MSADGGGDQHVGPPRSIEVQKFAAARSAEVQSLYNAVKDKVEASGGDPSSFAVARHLRRRTTSHNRRLPYWIVNERKKNRQLHGLQKKKNTTKNETPSAPGSTEKRKAEKPPPCRRVRRRVEFQRVRQGEDIVQRDGTRRLATHVWHAKRFAMKKCWGFSLPEGLAGRGRGSRAVLKWVKEAAVLHDASYYGLIELQGTSEAIARSLERTVEPAIWFPSSGCALKKAEAHGLLSGNAVLYQLGRAPHDAIAPINFLWRPPSSKLRAMDTEQAQANVTPEDRQLWIWVHPGAYESALQCLSAACERQEKDNQRNPVKWRSRRNEFARLEILGSKAMEVIRRVIHPTSRKYGTPSSKTVGQRPVCDSDAFNPGSAPDGDFGQPSNLAFFSKAEFLPSSAVLALDVLDPRCAPSCIPSVSKAEGGSGDDGTDTEKQEDIQSVNQTMGDDVDVLEGRTQHIASNGGERLLDREPDLDYCASWLKMAEEGLSREVSDSEYLWDPHSGGKSAKLVPMSEKKLCKKRHEERIKFLLSVNQDITTNGAQSVAKDQLKTSSVCPVLLLRSSKSKSPTSGWMIILPIKWVQAFWVPLVFAGGRVIGLRERHWLATNAGLPYFPHDFPDCSTYAQLLTANMAAANEENRKRPPAKRAPCFVVSPLQVSILRVFEDISGSIGNTKTDEPVISGIEAKNVVSRCFDATSSEKMSRLSGAEKLIHNLEEPHASCKFVEVERHEERSALDECQNEDKVPDASYSVPVVIELSVDSVILKTQNDVEGLGTLQSALDTEQEFLTQGSEISYVPRTMSVAKVNSGSTVLHNLLTTNKDTQTSEEGMLIGGQALENVYPQSTYPVDVDKSTSGGGAVCVEGPQAGSFPVEPACQVDGVTGCATDIMAATSGPSSVELNIQDANFAARTGQAVSSEARSELSKPDWSATAVVTFTDDGGGLHNQNAPSDPTVTESSKLEKSFPMEDRKTQLVGGLSASVAPESEPSDPRRATGKTFFPTRVCTPGHLVSYPVMNSVMTEVNVQQCHSKAPASAFNSHQSRCLADSADGLLENDALTVGLGGINVSKDSDIKPTSGECEEVARKGPLMSDEIMECVGEEYKDRAAHYNGENATRKSPSFFVARTQDSLPSGSQQALFLHQDLTSRGTIRDVLKQETLRWSVLNEATSSTPAYTSVSGEEKICYARVLVSTPRKGVLDEGAVILSPFNEDRDIFDRLKDWQGITVVQPTNTKQKRKRKEKKVKSLDADHGTEQGSKDTYENADSFCEAWSGTRKSIGLITSSVPHRSAGSCIGICDVGALMQLRAVQRRNQRWCDRRDIFVLAGNKYSSKLRPALLSLTLEREEDDLEWM